MKRIAFTLLSVLTLSACAQKKYVPAYPAIRQPDRIILTWKGDPSTSQAVTWRTYTKTEKAVAQLSISDPGPDFVKQAITMDATTTLFDADSVKAHYHAVNFENLQPDTRYLYRVGDGEVWSEWFQFRTAKAEAAPFSFIYFGDAQNDLKSLWSRTIREAYSTMPKAAFLLHAGDLVDRATSDDQWGEWFDAAGWINGMMPSMPIPGNHEYYSQQDKRRTITPHWKPQFTLPENGPSGVKEQAYFMDYQGVRFIALDSQGMLLHPDSMTKQAQWFEKVVDPSKKWTIVSHHHPIYSTKVGRDNKGLRDMMEPLYAKHKVDLVLQGHDHAYGRGMNIPVGTSLQAAKGPMYVVSVSGPKQYDVNFEPWMQRISSNTQLYQIIHINGDTLHYRAYLTTGDLYDAFSLIKQADGSNRFVEEAPEDVMERTELPTNFKARYTQEQMDEYRKRFMEYKARKK